MHLTSVGLFGSVALALACVTLPVAAQRASSSAAWRAPVASPVSSAAFRATAAANSSSAFALEALGGMGGSLIGMGIVAALPDCGVDDLACIIKQVGLGGILGAVGATVGTTLVARRTESRRSVAGAGLGAFIGTGVGLGVHWALNQGSDRNLGDAVVVPIFVVTQGLFSALGSRTVRF